MMPPLTNTQPITYNAIADAIGVIGASRSSTRLTLSSVDANPMTDGVNVVPSPLACAVNSCHQSQFTPSAARAAMRLAPRCASISWRSASASGNANSTVTTNTPTAIAGACATRVHPLLQGLRIMGLGEEAVREH